MEKIIKYQGSCIDLCNGFFDDATEMAGYIPTFDEDDDDIIFEGCKEITSDEFYALIPKDAVNPKHILGEHSFHRVNKEHPYWPQLPRDLYFIYNEEQDVHYFYS